MKVSSSEVIFKGLPQINVEFVDVNADKQDYLKVSSSEVIFKGLPQINVEFVDVNADQQDYMKVSSPEVIFNGLPQINVEFVDVNFVDVNTNTSEKPTNKNEASAGNISIGSYKIIFKERSDASVDTTYDQNEQNEAGKNNVVSHFPLSYIQIIS